MEQGRLRNTEPLLKADLPPTVRGKKYINVFSGISPARNGQMQKPCKVINFWRYSAPSIE